MEPVAGSAETLVPHWSGVAGNFGSIRMAAAELDLRWVELPGVQCCAWHHFLSLYFTSGQPPGIHVAGSLSLHLFESVDTGAAKPRRKPDSFTGAPAVLCSFLCLLLLRVPAAFSSQRHW